MPDPADLSPNFINPSYATPEQVQQLRAYAAQLMAAPKPSDIAPNWAGALAAGLRGALGPMALNHANQLQRQLLQQGANAIQSAGASNPAAGVVTGNPNALKAAILQQESGNSGNNPGQIQPGTWSQFANPNESINNPLDNRNVSGRILDKYMQQYGDPQRAAVAYFSGPGNVAPPGSPTPWIADRKDANGKSVSSYVADVTRRMGGGQQPQMAQNNPALSNLYMTPGVPQEVRDTILKANTPTPASDVYGRPGVQPGVMAGPQGLQPSGGFTPGYRAPASVGAGGDVSATVPMPALGAGPQGAAPQNLRETLNPMFQTGQQFADQANRNKTFRGQQGADIETAFSAIPVTQTLQTMKDDILSHGDKMIWGPTADWINNLRRSIAQHAPGFLTQKDLDGLASADSFEKLSAQLQTLVGRQAGATDMSLLQGIKSVPGSHNSKEGAVALIDMLTQVAGLNAKFVNDNQYNIGQPGFNYLQAKNQFFDQHPLVNPITKNPIRLDIEGKGQTGGGESKMINGRSFRKINGVWHEEM